MPPAAREFRVALRFDHVQQRNLQVALQGPASIQPFDVNDRTARRHFNACPSPSIVVLRCWCGGESCSRGFAVPEPWERCVVWRLPTAQAGRMLSSDLTHTKVRATPGSPESPASAAAATTLPACHGVGQRPSPTCRHLGYWQARWAILLAGKASRRSG